MSGRTTPRQEPRQTGEAQTGEAHSPGPDQRTHPQAPHAPARRRRQATGSRRLQRSLNLDENERRRERQQQFGRDIDEAAQEGQRRGDIVSSEPTTQALMNVPELKL